MWKSIGFIVLAGTAAAVPAFLIGRANRREVGKKLWEETEKCARALGYEHTEEIEVVLLAASLGTSIAGFENLADKVVMEVITDPYQRRILEKMLKKRLPAARAARSARLLRELSDRTELLERVLSALMQERMQEKTEEEVHTSYVNMEQNWAGEWRAH